MKVYGKFLNFYGGENSWRKEAMHGLKNAEKPKP